MGTYTFSKTELATELEGALTEAIEELEGDYTDADLQAALNIAFDKIRRKYSNTQSDRSNN